MCPVDMHRSNISPPPQYHVFTYHNLKLMLFDCEISAEETPLPCCYSERYPKIKLALTENRITNTKAKLEDRYHAFLQSFA